MRLPTGVARWPEAKAVGQFTNSLLSERSWVLRRIDAVQVVDGDHVERRVTFDVDLHELRRRARTYKLSQSNVPVPLMALVKEPILDLDVRTPQGDSYAIATRDQNAHLAHASLLAFVDAQKGRLSRLQATVNQQLHQIVHAQSDQDLKNLLATVAPLTLSVEDRLSATPVPVTRGEKKTWDRMLDIEGFDDRLIGFSSAFMLVCQVDLTTEADVEIVKVRLLEPKISSGSTAWFALDRLGWRPAVQRIHMGGLGNAASNHVRVIAPVGSVVRHGSLRSDGGTVEEVRDGTVAAGGQAPLDRFTVHRSGLSPSGSYEVEVSIEPSRSGFLLPAFFTTVLLTLLLAFATYLQGAEQRFSDHVTHFSGVWLPPMIAGTLQTPGQANFDAAVTVLVLLPSAVAIYLVRSGEHRVITQLMVVPRMLLLLSAFAAILAAGATAASVEPDRLFAVYCVATAFSGVTLITVSVPLVRIAGFRYRRLRANRS